MYTIHLLPASYGDSILIEYGTNERHYILIDGGPFFNFKNVLAAIKKVAPDLKEIELLVITHIDIDHIDGIITFLNAPELPYKVKEVWFNGWEQINTVTKKDDILGARQGEYLSYLIDKKKIPHNTGFSGKAVVVRDYNTLPVIILDGGMELTLLSPGTEALQQLIPVWQSEVKSKIGDLATIEHRLQKDTRYGDLLGEEEQLSIEEMQEQNVPGDISAANRSSIAFIGTFDGKRCLFAADATSDYLLQAIEPLLQKEGKARLSLNAWKLAHHGSKKSTLEILMAKIDCKKVLVSSDGKHYRHPDQVTIAKLLKQNGPDLEFYFNYRTPFNDMWDAEKTKEAYKYNTFYPAAGEAGISLKLH